MKTIWILNPAPFSTPHRPLNNHDSMIDNLQVHTSKVRYFHTVVDISFPFSLETFAVEVSTIGSFLFFILTTLIPAYTSSILRSKAREQREKQTERNNQSWVGTLEGERNRGKVVRKLCLIHNKVDHSTVSFMHIVQELLLHAITNRKSRIGQLMTPFINQLRFGI